MDFGAAPQPGISAPTTSMLLLKYIFHELPSGLSICDAWGLSSYNFGGLFIVATPKVYKLLGYDLKEQGGTNLSEIVAET